MRTAVAARISIGDAELPVTPVLRAQISAEPVDLVLDTGNQGGTQLWERFATDFPEIVSRGQKGSKRVNQIGGSADREVVSIPELRFRIGGFDALLRPANVFAKPVGNDLQHGNVGASRGSIRFSFFPFPSEVQAALLLPGAAPSAPSPAESVLYN